MEYALIYTFGNVIEQLALRHFMNEMYPLTLMFYFYVFAVVCALFYAYFIKQLSFASLKKTFSANTWSTTFVLAESIGTCLWMFSIWYIGISGMAAFGVMPKLFKMYYGVKVFNETLTRTQVILGVGVAIAAVIFGGSGSTESLIGSIFAICTAIAYTVAGIAQKHIAGKVSYGHIMCVRNSLNLIFVGGLSLIALTYVEDFTVHNFNISPMMMAGVALLAAYGSVFLRIMKLKSNETVPLSTLVVVYEANAPVLFLAGFFVLGETMTWPQGFAAVFMMFSTAYFIYINYKKTRKVEKTLMKS